MGEEGGGGGAAGWVVAGGRRCPVAQLGCCLVVMVVGRNGRRMRMLQVHKSREVRRA